MKPKYIIWSYNWNSRYGGIHVLHRLCHLMNICGYKAYLYLFGSGGKFGNDLTNLKWTTPLLDQEIAKNDIIIYPDCVPNNPLLASNVVRYMLYYPSQYFGGVKKCHGEYIVPFNTEYLDECKQCSDKKLTHDDILKIPIVEPELFHTDINIPKTKTCIYYGKGSDLRDNHNTHPIKIDLPNDTISITRLWPEKRKDLARLLQETTHLYLFDKHSAIAEEALMCDVQVKMVKKDGSIEDFDRTKKDMLYDPPYFKDNLLKQYNCYDKIHKFVKNVKEYFEIKD